MEVIVRMTKVNPWTGLIKWSNCFDYIGSYWTRSGSRYTGLSKVTVNAIETEELSITPTKDTQIQEGLYSKVTVSGDENLIADNIKQGIIIFGVEGNAKTTDLKITSTSFS